MADAEFIPNNAAIARFLGRNGPAGKLMLAKGQRVAARAKELVGYGVGQPGRPHSGKHLRDAIATRLKDSPGGVVCEIGIFGSGVGRAIWHHEGTEPHPIIGNPRLVFFWPKAGRVVAFPRVDHPGTKPNRFLTKALPAGKG